jgi:tripartite-type tricarboxylate transporter receptor subunit TctC
MNLVMRLLAIGSGLIGLAFISPIARADEQPVKILVGFAPGGTTDVLARNVAKLLGEKMGRPVIVENKAGASGNIAADYVAKAPSDGRTLLFVASSHATNATLYKKLSFNPVKDFSAVGLVATTPYVLVVHPTIAAKNVSELVSILKKKPGALQYASSGQGTGQHLSGELFNRLAKVEMTQIPYKGSAAALPDVLAGRTPVMFDNVAVMTPHVRSGAVRALAVTSNKRSELLPDVPPVADTLRGFDVQGWFALLAPAQTPSKVVRDLNAALNSTIADPAFRARLKELGGEPTGGTSLVADTFIRAEIERWRKIISEANIKLD